MAKTEEIIKEGIPLKAFYQEVREGDLKKYGRKSNNSNSGGGARDLRISPVKNFWDEIRSFFPEKVSDRKYKGIVYSKAAGQPQPAKTMTTLMAPTTARSNECRITRIFEIDGWSISPGEFDSKAREGFLWFYLLILDDKGQVWATKFCTDVLEEMHESIRGPISSVLLKRKKGTRSTIRNIIFI